MLSKEERCLSFHIDPRLCATLQNSYSIRQICPCRRALWIMFISQEVVMGLSGGIHIGAVLFTELSCYETTLKNDFMPVVENVFI